MKAVILAAGKGTRLRPFTYTKPKVLLPLANKPIIQYIVEYLFALEDSGQNLDEIFIVTNYLEKKVKLFFNAWLSSFKPAPPIKITFVHQPKLGGTGDALRTLTGKINEDFIMVNGDEVFSSNVFSSSLKTFEKKDALAIVGAFESDRPEQYGVLVVNSEGVLEKIVEKSPNPPGNLVNTGVYVFSPKIFEYLEKIGKSERGEYELTDAIMNMATSTGRVFISKIDMWRGVSILWDLFEANSEKVEERLEKEAPSERVIIGKNTKMKPGVHIEGDVIIGDNCNIGPNCYIRGPTAIGNNCHIGSSVEIKNCIIMDNSNVPHLSYVGDSVIGEHCNLGAGTMSANLRHDYRNIKVLVKDCLVESNRHKIGFFVADWTKTAVGTMIYPGRVLGPFAWTAPNATVDCNIEPFTLLGPAGKMKIPKEKIGYIVKNENDKQFLLKLYEELKNVRY